MGTKFKNSNFICPACSNEFESQIVKSVTHQGQDSDFFPHYLGENPLPYFLVQCPNCSYCAYPEDYEPSKAEQNSISSDEIKDILDMPIARKLPPEALRFFLAGKIYEANKRNPYHIGNLYLRGSWCCRILDNRKLEIEMQQLAVRFLKISVDRSTITNPDNRPIVMYLVGELYRRLEDKKAAREWFGTVEEFVIDKDQQWVLELTQKQAELNEHFIN